MSGRGIMTTSGFSVPFIMGEEEGAAADPFGLGNVQDWEDYARQAEQPSLLVVTDHPLTVPGAGNVTQLAEALGIRVLDEVGLGAATERLARIVDVDAVLLHCLGTEPGLDLLLARLDTMAGNQGIRLILIVGFEGLDHVHAIVTADRAAILCLPDHQDVVAELVSLGARGQERAHLHDIGRGDGADRRLDRMNEELVRLSRTIEALVQNRTPSHYHAPAVAEDDDKALHSPARSYAGFPLVEMGEQDQVTARQVRAVLRARRLRDSIFPSELFADPAWDIVLDLMAARLENVRVSVSSLCIAAAVPPTTALRWIRQLTERGLLERRADPDDGRRIFIALSDQGAAAVTRWFQESRDLLQLASGQGGSGRAKGKSSS